MEDAEQVMHLRGILSSSKAIKSMSEDWLVEAGLSPAPRGMAYLIFVICWPSFTPLFYFRFWIYANGHSVLCRNEPQGDEGNVRRSGPTPWALPITCRPHYATKHRPGGRFQGRVTTEEDKDVGTQATSSTTREAPASATP
ncbi:hypothetical protein GW17_00036669 [Ensete ventricosum]|nr:hypothetical protein GW17_00036669 [Ensete ventricosum]RZS15036.1 hypothetical protein BHM03_00046839 [Ensete ventricosum]